MLNLNPLNLLPIQLPRSFPLSSNFEPSPQTLNPKWRRSNHKVPAGASVTAGAGGATKGFEQPLDGLT